VTPNAGGLVTNCACEPEGGYSANEQSQLASDERFSRDDPVSVAQSSVNTSKREGFGAAFSTSYENEMEKLQSNISPVEIPSLSAVPTLLEIQERLIWKIQILKTELPKAQTALRSIEETLIAKARGFLSTGSWRTAELVRIVSGMQVLSGTIANTLLFVSKDRTDQNAWITVSISVIGSGFVGEQLMNFATILAERADTQEIDCSTLRDVSASIHEITKDINDPFDHVW